MPDISMCADRHCPSRQTCYRYRAVPSERQSWFGQGHREAGWAKCGHFVPVTKTDIIRPVENEEVAPCQ